MNALTRIETGGQLTPVNLNEAMQLATMMSKGKLVPAALQGSAADCLMVIEQAMRWGMSPFAVAQEVNVIQGRMMYSGKIVAAAVHTSGVLEGRLSYDFDGEGAELAVTVRGHLRGEEGERQVRVRLADAKTNNQHWNKSPEQMLSYHGARVWARRHAPEVMLGVYVPEEFDLPEPREVRATVVSAPGITHKQAPFDTSPINRMSSAQLDQATNGDQIPDSDAPKPDRFVRDRDRLLGKLGEARTLLDELGHEAALDSYNATMANEGVKAVWAKLRAERPELAAEVDRFSAETLERIHAAAAPPKDEEAAA